MEAKGESTTEISKNLLHCLLMMVKWIVHKLAHLLTLKVILAWVILAYCKAISNLAMQMWIMNRNSHDQCLERISVSIVLTVSCIKVGLKVSL